MLSDQVAVAISGDVRGDLVRAIELIERFRRDHGPEIDENVAADLDSKYALVGEHLRIKKAFETCEKTDGAWAERIQAMMKDTNAILTPPSSVCGMHSTGRAPETDLLIAFNEKIAVQALKNTLETALFLRKKYHSGVRFDEAMLKGEVERHCPARDHFCSPAVRTWLLEQAHSYVAAPAFRNTVYRDPDAVADRFNRQYADLNFNYVFDSNLRAKYTRDYRRDKLRAHYERLENLEGKSSYATVKGGYEKAYAEYQADETAFQAYAPHAPSEFEFTEGGKNFGLLNECRGLTGTPGLFERYREKYVRDISGGPDGILLFTKTLEDSRLQVNGVSSTRAYEVKYWTRNGGKCPEPYPIDFTKAKVERAVHQAIGDTGLKAGEIRERIAQIQSLQNRDEIVKAGADWIRGTPKAVAEATAGQGKDAYYACEMINAQGDKEYWEKKRDQAVTVGTTVAVGGLLVMIPGMQAAAGETIITGLGAAGLAGTVVAAGANAWNAAANSHELDLTVSSIMSGNNDLKAFADDQALREKIGAAYRQLVMDGVMLGTQASAFLATKSAAYLRNSDWRKISADARKWRLQKGAKPSSDRKVSVHGEGRPAPAKDGTKPKAAKDGEKAVSAASHPTPPTPPKRLSEVLSSGTLDESNRYFSIWNANGSIEGRILRRSKVFDGYYYETPGGEVKYLHYTGGAEVDASVVAKFSARSAVKKSPLPSLKPDASDQEVLRILTSRRDDLSPELLDRYYSSVLRESGVDPQWFFAAGERNMGVDPRVFAYSFAEKMAKAYGANPSTLRAWNGSILAHGSNSSSLLSFTEYGGKSGRILPIGAMERSGKIPFSGEVVMGRSGVNKTGISTTPVYRNDVLTHYAMDLNTKGGWVPTPEIRQHVRAFEAAPGDYSHPLMAMTKNRAEVNRARLDQWGHLQPAEQSLVKEGFPVVYGFSPKNFTSAMPVGGLTLEERVVQGAISAPEIKSIFVPKERIPLVQKILRDALGDTHGIYVSDIELLRTDASHLSALPH